MKTILIFAALMGIALSRPQISFPRSTATILRFNNLFDDKGFSYTFDTSDGIHQESEGILKNPGTKQESLEVHGSYSYIGPDSKNYTVDYVANEEGFQPAGTHLPPSAGVRKLGIPQSAIASLAGGGLG